jgi:uncharacterized membrane protein YbhN (UPF0104 family)
MQRILSHFDIHVGFINILELRMASYLPMILNYGVGQGVMAYLIKRQSNEPLTKVASVLLYTMIVDMYWVLTFAFCGSLFIEAGFDSPALVFWIRAAWSGASSVLLAMYFLFRSPLAEEKIQWLKARNLFHSLQNARLSDYFKVMLWRLPLHCATSTYIYFLALCFGVNIPFIKVITLLPLTIAVEAIPITPAGIGTVQITAILLFQNHVSGGPLANGQVTGAEIVLAMSLLFAFSMNCLKFLSGAIFWRKFKN